jgi:hypothetical protein
VKRWQQVDDLLFFPWPFCHAMPCYAMLCSALLCFALLLAFDTAWLTYYAYFLLSSFTPSLTESQQDELDEWLAS